MTAMPVRFGTRTAASSGLHIRPMWIFAVLYTGALGVILLWWANTAAVVGIDGWLTNAGRLLGLLAGYAVAMLLVLMARIPLLDRSVGTDRLARWHAMGGRYVLGLAVTHVLTVIWGSALASQTGLVAQGWDMILHYPEMISATVGLLLFVAVGIASARLARRRMSYEAWHLIHLSTYVAIFLTFSHQLANGAEFAGSPTARAAWYSLYLGAAGLMAWYRFLVPLRRALRNRLRVASVVTEAPGVISVYITGRRLGELRIEPGQFFRWRFLTGRHWWAANPYSLSAPAAHDVLRITVKGVGNHSARLATIPVGTRVVAEGPYGGLTPARARGNRILLIAGGVGITPLRTLFETLPARGGDLTLLYLTRRSQDLLFRNELERIAHQRHASLHYRTDDTLGAPRPLTAGELQRLVPNLHGYDVFVCGPPPMMRATTVALRAGGVPRRRIHKEAFEL